MMVPVRTPGIASGSTWCRTTWWREAPTPKAASRIDGGTAFSAARVTMMMVGRVISDRTMPPTRCAERGSPKKPRKTARPSRTNTAEGTEDRKSDETGKNGEVRGACGGRRTIKKTEKGREKILVPN